MVFFILLFGNHVKKFGSNFNQGVSFLSKSNLNVCARDNVSTLMFVPLSLGGKDFLTITGTGFF